MSDRVAGKVAFITGAARGQGRSHAVRLAEEGADIIAVDICEGLPSMPYPAATEADLAETVSAVEGLGRKIVASKVDVRDYDALQKAVNDGVHALGRLDIVSANAGIGSWKGLLQDMPADVWKDMLDINLTGVWHTAKVAIPHIINGGRGGSIVFTSSGAGLMGFPNIGHYVAAKHGVVGLMRSLALELAPHSIRVNTINPGQVRTTMIVNEAMFKLFVPESEEPSEEEFAAICTSLNALPTPWAEPIDISNALLYLSSDEARYVTGTTHLVDAGFLLKG